MPRILHSQLDARIQIDLVTVSLTNNQLQTVIVLKIGLPPSKQLVIRRIILTW